MKQGLSLRVSQHLALTPQLQQSIRLLQLSTLELGQEIQQMLDDNPFLEVNVEEGPEEFGPAASDARPHDEGDGDGAAYEPGPAVAESVASANGEAEVADFNEAPSWEGDGTTETIADDGEWGGEAPAARRNNGGDDDEVDAPDLARRS